MVSLLPDEDERRYPGAAVAIAVAIVVLAVVGGIVGVAGALESVHRSEDAPVAVLVQAAPATYLPAARPVAQSAPLAPMGRWTPAIGVAIADRALTWLNWPYSYGAGGAGGPSFGVAVDADSRNDPHVRGFDCSGLTMYALAPWLDLAHDAAQQYSQVGSFHPSLDTLQPGDLIFWSPDGTIGGIGHVAVYIGNGQVVQAPRSGALIRISRIDQVESGAMGATRPLT